MTPLKLQTRFFTLEIYRRGIVFTIASLLFASGVNLVNGNVLLALISIANKHIFHEDSNEIGLVIGSVLILISLFLFYLIIINWRIEIYSSAYVQVRKMLTQFVTLINYRVRNHSSNRLRELHSEAYQEYLRTVDYLSANQTNLDTETYDMAIKLSAYIGGLFPEMDVYINELNKLENNVETDYKTYLANKELPEILKTIKEKLTRFVDQIKVKEKFKLGK